MIARVPFTHRGRLYLAGEALDVSVLDAVILKRRGHAIPVARQPAATPAPVAEVVEDPPRARRHTKRRDLEPEP